MIISDLAAEFCPLITFSTFLWTPLKLTPPSITLLLCHQNIFPCIYHIQTPSCGLSAKQMSPWTPADSRALLADLWSDQTVLPDRRLPGQLPLCGTLRSFRVYRDVSKCFAVLVAPLFISSCNSLWKASRAVHLYINICAYNALLLHHYCLLQCEWGGRMHHKYPLINNTIRTSFTLVLWMTHTHTHTLTPLSFWISSSSSPCSLKRESLASVPTHHV